MKRIIEDKDQKIQKLIPNLKDTFKSSDFIEAFKTAYSEDYEMLEERFIQDERQTRSLDWKKNTIPTPEKYLVKAIRDFAKGHPTVLKRTAKGFKKMEKPAAAPARAKSTSTAKAEPKKSTTKSKASTKSSKATSAAEPAKSTSAAKAEPKKSTTKSKASTKSSKATSTAETANPTSAAKAKKK
jgi:hypothetical protein